MAMQLSSQRNTGFILFITLIFLQLFALLAMESVALMRDGKHALSLQFKQQHQEVLAKSLLMEMVQPLGSPCVSGIYSSEFIAKQSIDWWQAHACHGRSQGNDYYYLQESLETAICNQENKPVRYDRNTLLYLHGKDFYSAAIYQSIITNLNGANIPCQGEPKSIRVGIQMIRQLY